MTDLVPVARSKFRVEEVHELIAVFEELAFRVVPEETCFILACKTIGV